MARAPKGGGATGAATVEVVALVTLVVGAANDTVSHSPGARVTLSAAEAARLVAAGFAALTE